MCYSAQASLIMYILGTIFSILLITQKELMGWIFLFIIQIQILEFFLWKNQTCNEINNISSKLIYTFIILQPIVIYIVVGMTIGFTNIHEGFHLIVAIFGLITFYDIYKIIKSDPICSLANCEKPYLCWDWKPEISAILYFIIVFGMVLYYGTPMSILSIVGTFLVSAIISDFETFGSVWCFIAAGIPMFLYFGKLIGL
jgi:hypothetical protein